MSAFGRRHRRRVPLVSAVLLALVACSPADRPIRIGLAGPFTDPVGAPMLRAAELAVDEINQSGGINGRPIELVTRDDYGDADSAVSAATRLVDAGVVAVVGHVFSGTTLASAPVYNAARITQISPSSSSPLVTRRWASTPSGSARATCSRAPRWPASPRNGWASAGARSST